MENEQSLSGKRWLVGDFVIYPEQRVLQTADGNDVAVEPRVVDALILLCQRHGDYVTTDELMANIWQGRVVSDAAVRGAIRKLRTALSDSAKDPKYIQSSPKRGYRLIKSVVVSSTETAEPAEKSSAGENTESSTIIKATMALAPPHSKRFSIYFTLLLLVAAAITVIIYRVTATTSISAVPASIANYQTVVLSDLPGEKYSFDMSADGQWLAFTAKLQSDEPYQLYLLNRHSGALEQVTLSQDDITSVSFVGDSNALAYVEMLFQQANLYLIEDVAIAEGWSHPQVLLENYRSISGIESISNDRLLLTLGDHHDVSTRLYALNIANGELAKISTTESMDDDDTVSRVSSDARYIAYIALHKAGGSSTINIVDADTYASVYDVELSFQPQDIAWVTAQPTAGDLLETPKLWLLDGQNLYRLDAQSEELIRHSNVGFQRLRQDTNKLSYLAITSSVAGAQGKAFVIAEVANNNARTYLKATPEYTSSLHFLTNEELVAVVKVGDTYQLQLLSPEQKPQVLFESQEHIKVISRNDKKQKLLFSTRQQFFLLDSSNLLVSSLTRKGQTVANATFDIKGERVLYSNNVNGEWQLFGYDLESGKTLAILTDYRFIYAFNDRYVALNKDGDLFVLSQSFEVVRSFKRESITYNRMDQERMRSSSAIPLRPDMLLSEEEAKNPKNLENLLKPNYLTLESPDKTRVIKALSTVKNDVIVQLNPGNKIKKP